MIGVFKYLKGYVKIQVTGISPERFMNLCSNKNLFLWNIEKKGDTYDMYISLKGFYQLRPIVRKTGTKVVILQRYGLPFFVPVVISRKIFVLGFFLCVGFWLWSSTYIWNIELDGNFQITEDMFLSYLKENEIQVGMKTKNLDIELLEKEVRNYFPEITWISAKLDGTKLIIELKENDALIITTLNEEKKPANIVSEYDGIIESIVVRKGIPKVNKGDEVTKDMILVEGNVPVYNEDATIKEYIFVEADADIYLKHRITYSDFEKIAYIKKEYTGREKNRYFARIGDNEFKITEEYPFLVYDTVIKESQPQFFETLSIPIFGGSYQYREYYNVERIYTLQEAQEILVARIKEFILSLEKKGVQIIEKDVKIETTDDTYIISGDFAVIEKIGTLVEIK